LDVSWQKFENILDLVLESFGEHLICLIKNKQSQVVGLEETFLHHIEDSTWGSNDYMNSALKSFNIISEDSSSNARVHFNIHKFSNLLDDVSNLLGKLSGWRNNKGLSIEGIRINNLKGSYSETSCFASS
jgi:hypothetical protein